MIKVNADKIIGKLLKTFVPLNYNLNTGVGTPIIPPLKFYFQKELEEAGFYIFNTATPEVSKTQNEARRQILYKHKEITPGMGYIESNAIVDDLIKYFKENSKAYNLNCFPIGYKNNFFVYSINLSILENK